MTVHNIGSNINENVYGVQHYNAYYRYIVYAVHSAETTLRGALDEFYFGAYYFCFIS